MALINMPFILPECSAFGLSEIKAYTDARFAFSVQTDVLYIDHIFINEFGNEFYKIVNSDFYSFYRFNENPNLWVYNIEKSGLEVEYYSASIGDWIFRQYAFPDEQDNAESYFQHFFTKNPAVQALALELRSKICSFLKHQIEGLALCQYDIIGFTSRFQQQIPAIALARFIKQLNPRIIVFMGGPNCEFPAAPELAAHVDVLDFVFGTRYNLNKFGQWLTSYLSDDFDSMHNIPGVFSKQSILKDESQQLDPYKLAADEDDIEEYIIPDYNAYFQSLRDNGLDSVKPVVFFETSRGCPWAQCYFCGIDGYNTCHRKMEPSTAIQYLNNIMQYADRCKYFIGTDSSMPYEYIEQVLPYVSIPKDVYILYETSVKLTEREIQNLVQNRVKLLLAGIESLVTPTLKSLNKDATAFDNILFLKNCRNAGGAVNWNLLAGIPNNDTDDLKLYTQMIPKITHLYPPSGIWLISFQGPSDYVMNQSKHNICLETYIKQLEYLYPFEKQSLQNMAYFHFQKEGMQEDKLINIKIERCNQKIQEWKQMWAIEDPMLLPNLYREGDIIYNSRKGRTEIISLDPVTLDVLQCLDLPRYPDDIVRLRPQYSFNAIRDAMQRLNEFELLFNEGNQSISLVTKKPKLIR